MTLLAVDDLQAGYGETQVLDGVSLTVGDGEIVSLIGRNGVGKTTTLRSILGSLTPTAGRISFQGTDVTPSGPVETARTGISLVPEERRIFPGLTVEENLTLGQHGGSDTVNQRDVEWVYNTFDNLAERRTNIGASLSGGEQQMLAIARALVAGADLLMLDEPTEGLAPMIVERVQEIIRDINNDGVTILLVEQNVAVALDLADRLYILDKGEIVHESPPGALRNDSETLDRYMGISL